MGKGHAVNGMHISHSAVTACILFVYGNRFLHKLDYGNPWIGKPWWPTLTIGLYFNGLCIKNVIGQGCVVARVLQPHC